MDLLAYAVHKPWKWTLLCNKMTYLHAINLDILGDVLVLLRKDVFVTAELYRSMRIVIRSNADCKDVHCLDATAIVGSS